MSERKKSFLEEEEHKSEAAGMMRWLLTYADMITLLLGLFIVLVASREVNQARYNEIAAQAARVFGGGQSVVLSGSGKFISSGSNGILPYIKPPESGEGKGKQGDFTVSETGIGTRITVGDVLFPSGSAELSQKSKEIIDKVYKLYLSKSNNYIMIKGHTDDRPISSVVYPSNWELSSGRAGAVARYLVNKYNMPPIRITSAGYADTIPVASNKTEEGRAKNRRIEIFILRGEANRVMTDMQNASKQQEPKPVETIDDSKPLETPPEGGY